MPICGLPVPESEIRDHGQPCRYWGTTLIYCPNDDPVLTFPDPDESDDDTEVYDGFSDKMYHQESQNAMVAWLNGELIPAIESDYLAERTAHV